MFSTAEKTNRSTTVVQQKAQQQTFFRKAGEEPFLGSKGEASFFNAPIQAKLTVSSPDDPQEKEADAVADQVMRMPDPVSAPLPAGEEKIDKKEEEEINPKIETPVVSRISRKEEIGEIQAKQFSHIDCMFGENFDARFSEAGSTITSAYINRKPIGLHHSDVIQRSGRGPPTSSIPFEQSLTSSKGGGSEMPGDTRQFMESRFNADFSGVRIHTGSQAQALTSNIHAQAFAHGNDIYFNEGRYSPHTQNGGTLLAHELTHTIQQGASPSKTKTQAAAKSVATKNIIQRSGSVPVQLTNAVEKAKTVEGLIDANRPQADGLRTGWEHLVEIFKTTFGEDMVVSGAGGTSVKGAVAEQDIKKKRMTVGLVADGNRPGHAFTGERDAMPSWCGIFAFWALNKSGVPMPKWKLGERIIKPEAARAPGTTPMPGDIAYRNAFSHYAIVQSVSGNTVTTVNGNTAGEDNLGGQVQTKDHPISNWTAFFNPLLVMQGSLGSGEAGENTKPKSLAELRREGLLNRKEDLDEKQSSNQPEVQAKQELSNWHVGADGGMQVITPAIQKTEEDKELRKKDDEIKEEEKDKGTGKVHSVQKKNADCSVHGFSSGSYQRHSSGSKINIQTRSEDLNSSLTNNEHVPVSEIADPRERGPPLQLKSVERGIVQCSVIDDALEYTSLGALMDCVEVTDLDATSACLLRKARDVAMHIPGYRALRVVLNRDPITGEYVERNGRNFIEAAFDIMPGGQLLHRKLEEQHQLDAAATWIDERISNLESIVSNLFNRFDNFWNDLGITDFGSPMAVMRQGAGIVLDFISDIIDFAVDAALELLGMVKDFLLEALVNFIKENTTAYPLLTVILGEDPVTKQQVDRNGTNILNALLDLGGEEGQVQRAQMIDTGTFDRVVGYIDEGIEVFSGLYETIVENFSTIWDRITIDALMEPTETFRTIYNIFAEPVTRVLDFVGRVIVEILKLVKEVLFKRISEEAKKVRGYFLMTVIIGKDPFTDEVVPRSVENLIRGFMGLMEGGEEQFQQMKESGAIERAVNRVNAAVDRLNMTLESVIQLFIDLWNSFTFSDFLTPIPTFQRIIAKFGEPIGRLIAFVVEIVKIVVVVILEIMNFPFDLIGNIITRSMAAFQSIKRDPIGFLKNLLRAIKQGFIQFFDNIVTHLINGVVGWLMSELRDAGIPELTDFSLRGVISWVLEVLGISMEKIWEKLAAHPRIGPERVARIRGMIDTLEGIWTFIKDVQERGIAAIWEKIQEQLSNLWDTVLDAVKNWVMQTIITQVTVRLLSMLDPTGIMAVINSAIAIYSAVQSFIKYLREMLEIVNSFVNGVADIAEGNITTAANYLENTMGRAMPIVIGFLANQVGLGGVGRRIGEMIERVREMIDEALTWLVNRAVDTGMNLLDRVMGRGDNPADPLVGVKLDLHTEERAYLTNGAIRQDEANIVAQNVTRRNAAMISSIQVVDGGANWNYNIIQRTAEEGPRKEEVGSQIVVNDLFMDKGNETYSIVTNVNVSDERCTLRLLNDANTSVTYNISTINESISSGSWEKLGPGGSSPVSVGNLIKAPYRSGSYLAYVVSPFAPGLVTYTFRGQSGTHSKPIRTFVEMLSRQEILVMIVNREYLRSQTPSATLQNWARSVLPPTATDPAFPTLTVDGTAHADHIIAFAEIVNMANFNLLTEEQQIAVLNLQNNFAALSPRANTSKGSRSYASWTRHETLGILVDSGFRREMIRKEAEARQQLQAKIAEFLTANSAP